MIYFTGDTHGDMIDLYDRLSNISLTDDDILIILGDAGFNYHCNDKDKIIKEDAKRNIPARIFCIHGNHEARPQTISTYMQTEFYGGKVYFEPDYPNLLFAVDGERYYFPMGQKTISVLTIGGAYSIDKYYRIQHGWKWFADEQPDQAKKDEIIASIVENNEVNLVLTHTCPLEWQPTHLFLPQIDQSKVDKSTETFLSEVKSKLKYDYWLFGHFHGSEKITDKAKMLFRGVLSLEQIFCGK